MSHRRIKATLSKRPVATLTSRERASLASIPCDARLIYLLFIRPTANRNGVARVSEQRMVDGMANLHPDGGLSMARVRAFLDEMAEQGTVSPEYADQAYRLIVGVH